MPSIIHTHPERARLFADPADATRYVAGSNRRTRFQCPAGHRWTTTINSVVLGDTPKRRRFLAHILTLMSEQEELADAA